MFFGCTIRGVGFFRLWFFSFFFSFFAVICLFFLMFLFAFFKKCSSSVFYGCFSYFFGCFLWGGDFHGDFFCCFFFILSGDLTISTVSTLYGTLWAQLNVLYM